MERIPKDVTHTHYHEHKIIAYVGYTMTHQHTHSHVNHSFDRYDVPEYDHHSVTKAKEGKDA